MTTFPDLSNFEREVHHETLTLPINGHEYKFTGELSLKRGLQINRMREESRRRRLAIENATAELLAELQRVPTDAEVKDRAAQDGFTPRDSSLEVLNDWDELAMYLDLIGDENREALQTNGVDYNTMIHVGTTLFAWHMAGPDAARATWARKDTVIRPPVEGSASSSPPTTSPNGSTTKTPRSSAPRSTRGRTSSTSGASSKRTSTASTARTSRARKS